MRDGIDQKRDFETQVRSPYRVWIFSKSLSL